MTPVNRSIRFRLNSFQPIATVCPATILFPRSVPPNERHASIREKRSFSVAHKIPRLPPKVLSSATFRPTECLTVPVLYLASAIGGERRAL
jgi:hypothetical protein